MFLHRRFYIIAIFTIALAILAGTSMAYAQTNSQIAITRVLTIGAQGNDVSALQSFLKDRGYFTYPSITGYFGSITKQAVAAFQKDNKLEPVGYTGPKTRALIASLSLSNNAVPPTQRSVSTAIHPVCFAPAGLHCIPGTSVIQPFTFGSGYTPGFGGGGSILVATPETGDTTGPLISSVAASAISSSAATITWSTDEASNSQVSFGIDTSYGTASTSAIASTTHSIMLTGLASNTVYHYRVESTDASGNTSLSTDGTFTTTLPTYSSIAGIGDSVTVGVNASVSSKRWLNLTQSRVGASTLLNAGISGTVLQNSPASGGASLSSNGRDRYASAVLGANKKSALFFAYGFNDARYTAAPATFNVSSYLNDMREVMNGLLLGGYARADLYLLTPYYITDTGLVSGSAGFTGQTRSGYEAYVSAVQTIATEYGTKFTNVYTYMRDNGGASLIDTDNIHPIDAGHQVIADAIASTTVVLNPRAPLTGLSMSGTGHSVSVSVTAPSSGTVTGYEYELVNDSISDATVSASTTSVSTNPTITSVLNGTYRLKARAHFSDDTYSPWAFSSESVTVFASESVPPVISSIAVSTTTSTALIVWNTDESADSRIDFGTDTSYGTASTSAATSTSHSITLSGLSNGTTYHYRVQSTDVWGNVATSSDRTFTTQTVDTTFASDTFTESSGTLLTAHTPDTGGTWEAQSGSSPTTAATIDAAGGLYSRDNASIYHLSTVPTSADYFVEADFIYYSTLSNDNVGIALHMSTTTNSYYAARWSQSASAWQILRVVSGTATVLGTSYVDTFTSGVKHIKFTYAGGAITLAVDGTTRISTNSTAVPYGLPGIRMAIVQTATTGIHLDNFRAGY